MSSAEGNGPVVVNTQVNDKIGKAKTLKDVERIRKANLREVAQAQKEAGAIPLIGAALETAKKQVNVDADQSRLVTGRHQ